MTAKASGTLARAAALVPMLILGTVVTVAALSLARDARPAWFGPAFPDWAILVASTAAMTIAVLARTPSLGWRAAAWLIGTGGAAATAVALQHLALSGFDPARVDLAAGFPTLLVLDHARTVLSVALAIVLAQITLDLEPEPPREPAVFSGMIDR
jgi:hypothetical protein